MLRNSFGAACAVYAGMVLWSLSACGFLAAYRSVLWHDYGSCFLIFSAVFIVNLTCLIHEALRWVSLKDTGRRLAHMERQLRDGPTISEELTARIREQGRE